jgi:hypothetical protein
MSESPKFDLSTSEGGRGYIAHLFKTALKRHDFTAYITERLAADFACALARHFEGIKAREAALQQRLTAADERADVLETESKRLDLMVSHSDYSYDADRMQFKARIDVLEGLLNLAQGHIGDASLSRDIDAALKPADVFVDPLKSCDVCGDEHICQGCGAKGWTANCKECVPY